MTGSEFLYPRSQVPGMRDAALGAIIDRQARGEERGRRLRSGCEGSGDGDGGAHSELVLQAIPW